MKYIIFKIKYSLQRQIGDDRKVKKPEDSNKEIIQSEVQKRKRVIMNKPQLEDGMQSTS